MAITPLHLPIICFLPPNRLDSQFRLKISNSSSALARSREKTGYRYSLFRVKADGSGNEINISSLRALLNRKDEELSQLKQQIEEETIELCNLHARAKANIAIVERSIEESGRGIHESDEKLKGLKEVRIDFVTDAETVEIAGSFNGWQNHIRMDPNPLPISPDQPKYREPLLWSVVLWLYPGVYQIKFVVDGQWSIDPKRETAISENVANNVLRVD